MQTSKISTDQVLDISFQLVDGGIGVVLHKDGQEVRLRLPQALALCRAIESKFSMEYGAWCQVDPMCPTVPPQRNGKPAGERKAKI